MKLYKHYFNKEDTPYRQDVQPKKRYHTFWMRQPYKMFLKHMVVKVKFLGIVAIYKKQEG